MHSTFSAPPRVIRRSAARYSKTVLHSHGDQGNVVTTPRCASPISHASWRERIGPASPSSSPYSSRSSSSSSSPQNTPNLSVDAMSFSPSHTSGAEPTCLKGVTRKRAGRFRIRAGRPARRGRQGAAHRVAELSDASPTCLEGNERQCAGRFRIRAGRPAGKRQWGATNRVAELSSTGPTRLEGAERQRAGHFRVRAGRPAGMDRRRVRGRDPIRANSSAWCWR